MTSPATPPPGPGARVTRVYDVDLRRTLLRWAAGTVAVVALPLFGWPLVVVVVPGLATAEVAGVPLPWLLLGVGVYPLVWLAARWFVAGAERTERDYREALGQDADGPPPDGRDGPDGPGEGAR